MQASWGGKTQNMGCPIDDHPHLFLIVMSASQTVFLNLFFLSVPLLHCGCDTTTISCFVGVFFFLFKVIFWEIPKLPSKAAEGTSGTAN